MYLLFAVILILKVLGYKVAWYWYLIALAEAGAVSAKD